MIAHCAAILAVQILQFPLVFHFLDREVFVHTDIAVDPIDGTTLTATGRAGAIAAAEKGSMFDPGPAVYMEKIAVGPEGAGIVDIRLPIEKNLSALAKGRRKNVRDLNVMVLDRPRHAEIVTAIRSTGARITLIQDVSSAIKAIFSLV